MMMLREHEIGDRRLSEPSYSVAPISFMDPTVCIVMCCSLLYHVMVCVHLIICMLYCYKTTGLASTSVFGCLWLSVVLVILVHDSWVNRLVYILADLQHELLRQAEALLQQTTSQHYVLVQLWILKATMQ